MELTEPEVQRLRTLLRTQKRQGVPRQEVEFKEMPPGKKKKTRGPSGPWEFPWTKKRPTKKLTAAQKARRKELRAAAAYRPHVTPYRAGGAQLSEKRYAYLKSPENLDRLARGRATAGKTKPRRARNVLRRGFGRDVHKQRAFALEDIEAQHPVRFHGVTGSRVANPFLATRRGRKEEYGRRILPCSAATLIYPKPIKTRRQCARATVGLDNVNRWSRHLSAGNVSDEGKLNRLIAFYEMQEKIAAGVYPSKTSDQETGAARALKTLEMKYPGIGAAVEKVQEARRAEQENQ